MFSLRAALRDYLTRRLRFPEIPTGLRLLADNGFNPRNIFDVGAYQGDFARLCLGVWPESQIYCFEPLPHKVKQLADLALRHSSIKVISGLLGAKQRSNVPIHEMETASSVLEEHSEQNVPVSLHRMLTIDQFVQDHDATPDLLKLDVQGYELEVLKGAEMALPKIQVILAEINFLDIHCGVPLAAEIFEWLNQRHWVAYDICGLTRRPLDQALWQADILFVPHNSFLREDKRWSA